jgi:hypothetical protein
MNACRHLFFYIFLNTHFMNTLYYKEVIFEKIY